MYELTRLELEHIHAVLLSIKEEDPDLIEEEVEQALEIVSSVLNPPIKGEDSYA